MINCNNGHLEASGSTADIMTDIYCIADGLKKHFTEAFGEDLAEKFLRKAFNDGMTGLSEAEIDELNKKVDENVDKKIDDFMNFLRELFNENESEEK